MNPGSGKYDICIIGGGYMGSAVAVGLIKSGAKILMLDKISDIHKASKANFGLIWSQSKGDGNRAYSRLSEKAVLGFKDFIGRIEQESGIDTELRLGCGIVLCIGEAEFSARSKFVQKMHSQAKAFGEEHSSQMLGREDIQHLIGKTILDEKVSGGSYSPIDGDVNPLLLLKAMRRVYINNGGKFFHGDSVQAIKRYKNTYLLDTSEGRVEAPKIVLAAGLGNIGLLSFLGKDSPLVPQKGQLLVTERVKPFLSFPCSGLRQTACGSVMIGYTNENTGFEVGTTVSAAAAMAKRAIQTFPCLRHVRVTRSWAGLRVLTKDGAPIYDEVEENAYLLATHSCVTLASMHERLLPAWILGGKMPDDMNDFNLGRFHV